MNSMTAFGALLITIRKYFFFILSGWTLIIIILAGMDQWEIHRFTLNTAKKEAIANLNKDVAFREWAAMHGGVYVLVDEKTPPNPYLSHIPERDIETPSGKKLTLMNPAYMARQLNEYFAQSGRIFGHITSLKLTNPLSKPDAWEENALRSFEYGNTEKLELTQLNGKPYMRLMHPIIAKKGCLKCHGWQGYKEGEVRGGVSVSIPMDYYFQEETKEAYWHLGAYSTIWLLGCLGLFINFRYVSRAAEEGVKTQERLFVTNERLEAEMEVRKRNEAELKKLTDELRVSNTELEQFAHLASHDLREPLREITSYLQLLHTNYAGKLDTEADSFIHHAVEGAKKMHNRIEDILTYSSVSDRAKRHEKVEASECLSEAVSSLSSIIDETGASINHAPLPVVTGGREEIIDLFLNLLENAIKFTPKERKPVIEITSQPRGSMIEISIKDNGIGIESQYFDMIFKMFKRLHTERKYSGTGIGLAICKKIVERHSGEIWVESTPGEGSVFHFTLPAA